MPLKPFDNKSPQLGDNVYVHESSLIIGDVTLGNDVSIWPLTIVRGDIHNINIGDRTNIQDGSVLHVTHASDFNPGGFPLNIGSAVTVGHKVTLHGCTIGNHCLIGMGAIIMDGAIINDNVLVGAGSIVPPGRELDSGHLYVGSPVKRIRPINDKEALFFKYSADNYVRLKDKYLAD